MRVLAVAPYYEPEGGGLERYAHAILERLAARGHDARVLAFTRGPAREERRGGVAVRRIPPRWVLSNTPLHPGFGALVRGELRAWRPDVLVAHTPVPFPAEVAAREARRARVPWVVTYHAGRLEGGSPLLDALAAADRATFEAAMLHGAARLVAVSPFVRDHALREHAAKTVIIPPGVDLARFRPAPPPGEPGVLFVGPLDRAYRWKGVDVLWQAFLRLRQTDPGATLTLVGEGDRRAEFAQRARAAGLAGAVRLPGRLAPQDLVRAYQAAAVTVLPSTSAAESFGMVLAEANACDRPVVGSRVGGVPSFVEHGVNGLLAEPGDPAALADALAEVLHDPERGAAMGRAGRRKVERAHDWDGLARRTEDLLGSVAAAAPSVVA